MVNPDNKPSSATPTSESAARAPGPRRRERLGRIGFTIAEAARALGVRPDAFRRLVERHARREGDEQVARLSAGVVARKRNGLARWVVIIPAELRTT
jgi:hypothetical protein